MVLLILEIMKQAKAIADGGWYPLWALPFQLCSVPIYLMPLVAFGPKKLSAFVAPGCFTINLFAALAMLAYPSTVLGTTDTWFPLVGNYYPIVSWSFHGTMIFFSLYLLFSKQYTPRLRDYPRAYLTMVFFAIIAIIANAIWNTDMMFLNTAYGMPFGFILYDYGRAAYWIFMAVLAFIVLGIPFFVAAFLPKRRAAKEIVSA